MNLTISELFTHLLGEKRFYAHVANALQRVSSDDGRTMAVGIHKGRMVLWTNPSFISKVSMPMGVFVLEHEMVHLVMDHIPRYFELIAQFPPGSELREKAKTVYNIAMDCAVNSLLRKNKYFEIARLETQVFAREGVPEEKWSDKDGMVLPENYDLPDGRSFEFYQHELMKRCELVSPLTILAMLSKEAKELLDQLEQDGQKGVGGSHGKWDSEIDSPQHGENLDADKMSADELKSLANQLRTQAKQMLKKVSRDFKKQRGLMPSGVEEWLAEYLADPITPWWELLTSMVTSTKRSKPHRGIQRPNRPLTAMAEEDATILPAIGVTYDPKFRVFFMTDTSGSMSTDELQIAKSELEHLLKADDDMEVRYIQGDAAIHFDEVFHTGDKLPQEMHGRGGTDFESYFEYMWQYVENDDTCPDIVIVYTDAGAPVIPAELQLPLDIPVVWLVTRESAAYHLAQAGYGTVIECNPEQSENWKEAA